MNAAHVREQLEESRRRGEPFDRAWRAALEGLAAEARGPHGTTARREARAWRAALGETRREWERAYSREASPEVESVAALEDAVA